MKCRKSLTETLKIKIESTYYNNISIVKGTEQVLQSSKIVVNMCYLQVPWLIISISRNIIVIDRERITSFSVVNQWGNAEWRV